MPFVETSIGDMGYFCIGLKGNINVDWFLDMEDPSDDEDINLPENLKTLYYDCYNKYLAQEKLTREQELI